jgi:hypothetical protein
VFRAADAFSKHHQAHHSFSHLGSFDPTSVSQVGCFIKIPSGRVPLKCNFYTLQTWWPGIWDTHLLFHSVCK